MIGLVEDLRDALRQIRRRPIQALAAVTVLAIGLSAGIAAFTYVNAFSQPFPGVAASFAVAGLVRGLLHGVEPTDLRALAGGLAVLLAASVAAAYLPARRASRVDPIRALRPER